MQRHGAVEDTGAKDGIGEYVSRHAKILRSSWGYLFGVRNHPSKLREPSLTAFFFEFFTKNAKKKATVVVLGPSNSTIAHPTDIPLTEHSPTYHAHTC